MGLGFESQRNHKTADIAPGTARGLVCYQRYSYLCDKIATAMREKLNVSFYCREQKAKDGKAPVEVCLNTKGKRTVFTMEEYYAPEEFKRKRTATRNNDVKELLEGITAKFKELHRRFPGMESSDYKRLYLEGVPVELSEDFTVAQLCRNYVDNVVKGLNTERHYVNTFERFCERYGTRLAGSITPGDIKAFLDRLRDEEGYAGGTLNNYRKRLSSMYKYAFERRFVQSNPFAGFRMKFEQSTPTLLTLDEVTAIQDLKVEGRLGRVKDLFLWACWTGQEYSDIFSLEPGDVKERNGIYYIHKRRVKTNCEYTSVLIGGALGIWKRWEGLPPQISNQVLNRYIKELCRKAGIENPERVSSIAGRHFYATALLSGVYGQKIPLSVVQKVLGHNRSATTQIYAKLLDESLFDEFGDYTQTDIG